MPKDKPIIGDNLTYTPICVPYQICPKCGGQGVVSKPPHIADDVQHWISSDTQYKCNLCDGKMMIPMHQIKID